MSAESTSSNIAHTRNMNIVHACVLISKGYKNIPGNYYTIEVLLVSTQDSSIISLLTCLVYLLEVGPGDEAITTYTRTSVYLRDTYIIYIF